MDKYIHTQNLLLFRRRLAEAPDEQQRKIVAQLLAEETAKDPPQPGRLKPDT